MLTQGPVEYLTENRPARLASLAGAGFAVAAMARRSSRSRGLPRFGWFVLAVLEAFIFLGILASTSKRERSRRG